MHCLVTLNGFISLAERRPSCEPRMAIVVSSFARCASESPGRVGSKGKGEFIETRKGKAQVY